MTDDPYPEIERWLVGWGVIEETAAAMGADRDREAQVLWLGFRGRIATVTTTILLVGQGVTAGHGSFDAAPEVMGAVTRWARVRKLTLLGDVHSHPVGVSSRLSDWDRRNGFAVPEFLAVVVGHGGRDPVRRWSWNIWDRATRRYCDLSAPELRERLDLDEIATAHGRADAAGVQMLP